MRVAITGGAGFIGHNLAIHLHQVGFSPLVFDSLERSSSLALRRLASTGLKVVKGDVRDGYALKSVVKNVDVVVHAAAYVSVEESFIKPAEYMSNNVGGTASVASVCSELGKPLIYLS
ncbi:MAG: NAD-dependent epimerase/dehydratase family protein, partial [Desulfurococcaceae archaeon]